MKNEKLNLRQRMYGLVPYNISPIQQGIQFGHAVVEYSLKNHLSNEYLNWAKYDKTFIILNGGTTNKSKSSLGTLNSHAALLKDMGIEIAEFYEPDLGDQLTAVVFLVDERVWDRESHPSFAEFLRPFQDIIDTYRDSNLSFEGVVKRLEEEQPTVYRDWVDRIGGKKNEFLTYFLKNFKLA